MKEYFVEKPMPHLGKDMYSCIPIPNEIVAEIRADAIDDVLNSLLLMIKNGYDYPNAEFEGMFIALVEDAIDSVKDNLKEKK